MYVNPKIIIERDFLKDAKINPQREKLVFYNYTNQFQQYYDNDDDDDDDDNDNDDDDDDDDDDNVDNNDDNDNDNDDDDDDDDDNDNDNVDNNDDNDNKQNKSKIAAPKNIKLPPTFRATRQVDRVGQHFERGGVGKRRHNKAIYTRKNKTRLS